MTRLRELGVTPGRLPAGEYNAITDVTGVRVGQVTLISGDGKLVPGQGPVRTGVTAIVPHETNIFREKVAAAVHTINGFGKVTGFEQIRERGTLETPILLTNTLNVGLVSDAVTAYMLRDNPDIGMTTGTVNPAVGECNDAFLNDIRGRHVREAHVLEAIESAIEGEVAEGNVGAGTGTALCQFKGGIGTASRMVMDGAFAVGALVQTNFGLREELTILGVPVGRVLREDKMPRPGAGSIMIVLATNAPFSALQLTRLAKRATFGLARTGSICADQSGDFVIAFSTSNRMYHYPDTVIDTGLRFLTDGETIDEFFLAAIESVEEAILNALVAAETMTGRDGNTLHAIPEDRLAQLLEGRG